MAIFDAFPKIVCLFFIVLFFLVIILSHDDNDYPKVLTSYGLVQGKWKNEAALFLGIPYAKAPIGNLQFKKAEPPNPWNTTLTADTYGAKCLTLPTLDKERASADCLFLNVFSFSTKPKTLLPVVILFHGGNYESGSAEDFSEYGILRNFVSQGLVVVTFNYRLNFYGFFTTFTDDFPPNLDLWDQFTVLQWVRNEIHIFGGDPRQITLLGHGTGASSVALHLYSPHSAGLFKRVIMQSGSAYSPFAVSGNRYKIESSKIMAVALRCCTEKEFDGRNFSSEAIRCLKTTDQGKIWQTLLTNFTSGANHDSVYQGTWAPVVDNDFLPNLHDITSTNIEILIGSTANEKGLSELPILLNTNSFLSNVTKDVFDLAVANLARPEAFPKTFRLIADLLSFVYGSQHIVNASNWLDRKITMSSDYWVNAGVLKQAHLLSQKNNTVYLYSFDYVSTNFYESLSYNLGAIHGMDIALLIPGNETLKLFGYPSWSFGKKDKHVQNIMSTFWYNFVKTGNPNGPINVSSDVWLPVNPNTDETFYRYLSITTEPRMNWQFHHTAGRLWNWMVPRMSDTPLTYSDTLTTVSSNYTQPVSHRSNVYNVITWILVVVILFIVFIYLITFIIYRRKLRTYQVLKRVEELNFT